MHYIRRYMMLVYPVAGDVTLDDLIRVVFLSGSFNFRGYCWTISHTNLCLLTAGAGAVLTLFLTPACEVSALLVALFPPAPPPLSFLLWKHFTVWFEGGPLRPPQVHLRAAFPWWPWHIVGRALVFVFGRNCLLTFGIPRCYGIVIGFICWQMFSWWGDNGIFFRFVAWSCYF